jgi:peptide-N4-(N-acetyl-beta-glucosaminyl)asparagine amidase
MVLYALVVQHERGGTSYTVDYDSDDGEETLKVQLFSLAGVLPENQKLVGLSDIRNGQRFLTLVEKEEDKEEEQQERTISQDLFTGIPPALDSKRIAILDEELARALELEDAVHANPSPLQRAFAHTSSVREAFESELLPYFHRWAMYEDVARQKAARATLSLDELEEDALVALAREGKRDVSGAEKADAMLLQLLYWFKKSFKWVDQPDCDVCGSASVRTGMGSPTREELAFEANRVELFRCRKCKRDPVSAVQ